MLFCEPFANVLRNLLFCVAKQQVLQGGRQIVGIQRLTNGVTRQSFFVKFCLQERSFNRRKCEIISTRVLVVLGLDDARALLHGGLAA